MNFKLITYSEFLENEKSWRWVQKSDCIHSKNKWMQCLSPELASDYLPKRDWYTHPEGEYMLLLNRINIYL